MDKNRVYCLISTVKDWSNERKKDAICILESLRDCFLSDECLFQNVEEDGKNTMSEEILVATELTEIINQIKESIQ